MIKQTQMTTEGLEALKKELSVLVDTKRPQLVKRLSHARTQGDLAENNDYQNAREELDFLDGRISELEDVIKNVVIIKNGNGKKSVDVGNHVIVKVDGKEVEYHIVGEWEANPMEKKISNTSPLGMALVGKSKGEKVSVEAPAGTVVYEIVIIK